MHILDIVVHIWSGVRVPVREDVLGEREEGGYVQAKRVLRVQHHMRYVGTFALSYILHEHSLLHGWIQANRRMLLPHLIRHSFDRHH